MRLAGVLFSAYIVTGIYYVWRDLSERNPLRKTFYVIKYHETKNPMGLILAGLGWLPGAIINAYYKHNLRGIGREAAIFAVFCGSAVIFWIISN